MNLMKGIPTERKLVVVLFILVLITFSLAQRDSKRLDRLYTVTLDKTTNVAAAEKTAPLPLR